MTKALVFHPHLLPTPKGGRAPSYGLEEAGKLARTIDLEVMHSALIPLKAISPATYIGSGKVKEIADIAKETGATLVIMDSPLSPTQQRNLEKGFNTKVIDRTALILEIFGARARTAEGKLQVELAAMEYQKGRLVRAWTHLERQRGGFGFAGGPGETQIELDRRKIRDRIALIRKDLDKVKSGRALQRNARAAVPYPVVALVGYTNAGKSTLFNLLTDAKVLAEDKLFATLDPTMRVIRLPSRRKVILSDTVGFISDLPTQLVAAFRATLEEVEQAALLLHVRDSTAEDSDSQKKAVLHVLHELDLDQKVEHHTLEVQNKIDALDKAERPRADEKTAPISALTGEGIPELLEKIDVMLGGDLKEISIKLKHTDQDALNWLYAHALNVDVKGTAKHLSVKATMTEKNFARWEKMQA